MREIVRAGGPDSLTFDAVAEREMLLELPGASDHAAELRRRAAEASYQLDGQDDRDAR